MTHYADNTTLTYLGEFDTPPENGFEVPYPPKALSQKWSYGRWSLSTNPPQRLLAKVSPLQAKLALNQLGLLDQVEALINSESSPKEWKIAWEYALEFRRLSPMLTAIAQILNMTDDELDNIFTIAKDIEV